MPTLAELVTEWFDKTWNVHKSGDKEQVKGLERPSTSWSGQHLWNLESNKVRWDYKVNATHKSLGPSLSRKNLRRSWASAKLAMRRARIPGEEQLNPLIPRIKGSKSLSRLRVKLKSSGMSGSMSLKRQIAALEKNTLFVEGKLADGSPVHAAVWFERNAYGWEMHYFYGVSVGFVKSHPALHDIFMCGDTLVLDSGLDSLELGIPMFIDATFSAPAGSHTLPILVGAHYYLGYRFGPNLQAAVRQKTPLVLICNPKLAFAWRSTPFHLEFPDITLRNCQLFVRTREKDGTPDGTSYIIGRAPDHRLYYAELGSDTSTLRWTTYLTGELAYVPADDPEDEEAMSEDDFFQFNPAPYPDLDPTQFDACVGGDDWQRGPSSGPIYASLKDAQFIHMQFGIALTTLRMTDAALTFRGTPTLARRQEVLDYGCCLFRVAVAQPFNSSLRHVTRESHLAMTIVGCSCEGYIDPDESAPVINMCPKDDAEIGAFFQAMGGILPDYHDARPFDQMTLRIHLASAAWQLSATNGVDDEVTLSS